LSESRQITVRIVNRLGLHARPAMTFVDLASTFGSAITVTKGDTTVNGKSIMEMMMLAASQGSELVICADGADCTAALDALKRLVDSGFDEE